MQYPCTTLDLKLQLLHFIHAYNIIIIQLLGWWSTVFHHIEVAFRISICVLIFSCRGVQCIRVYLRHPLASYPFGQIMLIPKKKLQHSNILSYLQHGDSETLLWLMVTYTCNKYKQLQLHIWACIYTDMYHKSPINWNKKQIDTLYN